MPVDIEVKLRQEYQNVNVSRRKFVFAVGSMGVAAAFGPASYAADMTARRQLRRFKFVHIDVFTSNPLAGNPLDVFLNASGMSDSDMLAITRETYLSEATFVFPRDAAIERERGIRVRIFTPDGEIPFAGHPTLGTATVLRNLRLASTQSNAALRGDLAEISLDLTVGKIPVAFSENSTGQAFGEMHQVPPKFGAIHDKETVAKLHNLSSDDIADFGPIQTVSTGLPFAIVPLKRLAALEALRIDAEKMNAYVAKQEANFGFYYVTRDTADSDVGIRARCLFVGGEDAATGSAAGCLAGWLVRNGVAAPDQVQHIRQGVEMKRTSDIFVRAGREGANIVNVRVGGYAVQTMEGEIFI
jgi:trans-2,3-dihydro-3-hydroxyanthranilate isomerase